MIFGGGGSTARAAGESAKQTNASATKAAQIIFVIVFAGLENSLPKTTAVLDVGILNFSIMRDAFAKATAWQGRRGSIVAVGVGDAVVALAAR